MAWNSAFLRRAQALLMWVTGSWLSSKHTLPQHMRKILPLTGRVCQSFRGLQTAHTISWYQIFLTSGGMFWPPWLFLNIFIHTSPQRADVTLCKTSVFQSGCIPRQGEACKWTRWRMNKEQCIRLSSDLHMWTHITIHTYKCRRKREREEEVVVAYSSTFLNLLVVGLQ